MDELTRHSRGESRNESLLQVVLQLVAGVSGQLVHCDGREQCAKQRIDQQSVTPFLDIRVKSQVQDRFSVPFTWYSAVDKTGNAIAPTFTFGASFSGP